MDAQQKCMDAQQYWNGHTTEFAERNLHRQTVEFAWTNKFDFLGQTIHIFIFLVPFVMLRPKFDGCRSQSSEASYCG